MSDSDHSDFATRSPDKPFHIDPFARENHRLSPNSRRHHDGIKHICCSGQPKQSSRFVRLALTKRNHHTTSQEAPELDLLWRPADLGDDRCGNQRDKAKFQTGLVFSPRPPLVSVRGHENGGVVNDGAHVGRRTVRDVRICARTLRRASFISSEVRRPCCFSHRATAAKPARRCNVSRAALVIHAETLTLSRAAAPRMFL